MKTELRLAAHQLLEGQQVIEIWHNGLFLGTVTGADGPGVRILSKYSLVPTELPDLKFSVVEVSIL